MSDTHGDSGRQATLAEALDVLDALLPEETKTLFRARREKELFHEHWGLGLWVRNALGLWDNAAPLTAWFCARGSSTDEMSGEVVRGYWRRLKGLPPAAEPVRSNPFASSNHCRRTA